MPGLGSRIASLVEKHSAVRPLQSHEGRGRGHEHTSGITIAVIGGGLSGPAFARRALTLAGELGTDIRVELLTRPSCNYCAGLITDVSLKSMQQLYRLTIPADVIKETINEVVFINPQGCAAIPLLEPLTSVLRTSRFKQQGFDESWVEQVFQDLHSHADFTLHLDATVENVKSRDSGGFKVTYDRGGSQFTLDADVLVIATGLKSIQQPWMQEFIAEHGYRPPGLMDASVTEINTTKATHYDLSGKVLVVDGVIRNCIAAFIPKGKGWLTVTGLGKILADHDMEILFNHPLVQEYIRLDQVIDNLRCRKICSASVITSPARKFYGDSWVMVGDLTGYGRVLKDGYFAALESADLAAKTILFHGWSKSAFGEHYARPLRKLSFDNRLGMWMFWLDQRVIKGRFGTYLLTNALREMRGDKRGGMITAAFRGLFSGELSYKQIYALFTAGTLAHGIGLHRKCPEDTDECP